MCSRAFFLRKIQWEYLNCLVHNTAIKKKNGRIIVAIKQIRQRKKSRLKRSLECKRNRSLDKLPEVDHDPVRGNLDSIQLMVFVYAAKYLKNGFRNQNETFDRYNLSKRLLLVEAFFDYLAVKSTCVHR